MGNVFLSSDHHFGHANIIEYCKRPFMSLLDMDNEMQYRWNEVVKPEDTVYYLGDFSFEGAVHAAYRLSKLNGTKHLIRGNHDRSLSAMERMGFATAQNFRRLDLPNSLRPYLVHNPAEAPDDESFVLCGHVHEKWHVKANGLRTFINVGVDQWAFAPVPLGEIIALYNEANP